MCWYIHVAEITAEQLWRDRGRSAVIRGFIFTGLHHSGELSPPPPYMFLPGCLCACQKLQRSHEDVSLSLPPASPAVRTSRHRLASWRLRFLAAACRVSGVLPQRPPRQDGAAWEQRHTAALRTPISRGNPAVGALTFIYVKAGASKMVPTIFLSPYFAGDQAAVGRKFTLRLLMFSGKIYSLGDDN